MSKLNATVDEENSIEVKAQEQALTNTLSKRSLGVVNSKHMQTVSNAHGNFNINKRDTGLRDKLLAQVSASQSSLHNL